MLLNKTKYQHKNYGKLNISHINSSLVYEGRTSGIALKYVMNGRECYEINGKQYHLVKGQFIILHQHMNYKLHTKNIATDGFCLDINLELLGALFLEEDLLFNQPYVGTSYLNLGKQLRNLNKPIAYDINNPIRLINSFAEHLVNFQKELLMIKRALQETTKKIDTLKVLSSKLLLAKSYIHINYANSISLASLASISGISRYHFARTFKACFKATPWEMQNQLRMIKAAELIKQDSSTLTTIAYHLGYVDLASFSKAFKQYYAMPPSLFLK